MTPANKLKLEKVAAQLILLVDHDADAKTCVLILLDEQEKLIQLIKDFSWRPEANDAG